jgi:GTP1/Obg family GTP-binding protein
MARVRARSRRITPQAGHALEILAHAIEYLTDEFMHAGLTFSAQNEQLQAVQMLMALNRQVYFECPEAPSFGERCRALLHPHEA